MRTPTLCAAALALAACDLKDLPSNLPDSGIECRFDTGTDAGSGTVVGSRPFTAPSAYQVSQLFRDERVVLSVQLYDQPTRCDDVRWPTPDGGPSAIGDVARFGIVTADVYSARGTRQVLPGTYPVAGAVDSAYATVYFMRRLDGGTAQSPDGGDAGAPATDWAYAASGSVTLATVDACSASGSFDVELDERDGGRTPLAGTFGASYCPTR